MIIRRATKDDQVQLIQQLDKFNNYYYEEDIFSQDFIPFWEYKDKGKLFEKTVSEWLSSADYLVFVAEEDNEMVGYICGKVREREPRVLDKEGYIMDWFVDTKWRHKGVGMKLYEQLLSEFKREECNRLGLFTNVRNKDTIDFYHKLGFIDESLTMVKRLE